MDDAIKRAARLSHGSTTIFRRMLSPDDLKQFESAMIRAEDPLTIVIFGASGDLAQRKLIPALYHLQCGKYMTDQCAVIGFSRSPMSDEAYCGKMVASLRETLGAKTPCDITDSPIIKNLHYVAGDNDDAASFQRLKEKLLELEKAQNMPGNRLFYLSVSPSFFPIIVKQLSDAGLISKPNAKPWTRVIIEKPFGRDLESAKALNADISSALDESQIFRIDHYLGKETVQNVLSFRFGNTVFEPLFNRKYIEHVQITVAEPIGMEGKRGAYYDTAGATRDMVQNHLLQLLTLVAMEPPPKLDAKSIHDAKSMLLRSLVPFTTKDALTSSVRGQYGPGEKDGKPVKGYREEENVAPDSTTETYVALKVNIENWRWAGVPFYLRTGKRLTSKLSEIAITFRQPPTALFQDCAESDFKMQCERKNPNQLVIRIQPDEGISLSVACKRPGLKMSLEEVDMSFLYDQVFKERSPEAYERLLLDAMRGDPTLFTRADEVFDAWSFIDSVKRAWANSPPPVFPNYAPGSDGPADAAKLFGDAQTAWRPVRTPETGNERPD